MSEWTYMGARLKPGAPLTTILRTNVLGTVEGYLGGEWMQVIDSDLSYVERDDLKDRLATGDIFTIPDHPWSKLHDGGVSDLKAETDLNVLVNIDDIEALADRKFGSVEMYVYALTYWKGTVGQGRNVTVDSFGMRHFECVWRAHNHHSVSFRSGTAARKWSQEQMAANQLGHARWWAPPETNLDLNEERIPFAWIDELVSHAGERLAHEQKEEQRRIEQQRRREEERARREAERLERALKGPTTTANNSEFARIIAARRKALQNKDQQT